MGCSLNGKEKKQSASYAAIEVFTEPNEQSI